MRCAESLTLQFVVDGNDNLDSVRSVEFDRTGRLLFVGTTAQIRVFNVDQNGQCLQQIVDSESRSESINGLCFHSDLLFVLSSTRCTAYSVDEERESDPVDVDSALVVCSMSKEYAFGPLQHLGVADFNGDRLMLYVAASRLESYVLSIDSVNGTLSVAQQSATESVSGWTPTPVTSLQIDHKNRVLLVSRKKSIKSYRIGINETNALRSIEGGSFAKIAINYGSRKHKQVVICHDNPCSIQLRKYSNR